MCYNAPFRLSPQWLCGNSCTWAHDARLQIGGSNEPRSLNKQNKERNISRHKWSPT